jgi:hypothetical protein
MINQILNEVVSQVLSVAVISAASYLAICVSNLWRRLSRAMEDIDDAHATLRLIMSELGITESRKQELIDQYRRKKRRK